MPTFFQDEEDERDDFAGGPYIVSDSFEALCRGVPDQVTML